MCPQPLVLERESDEREKHDVVVLLHVLRVMQMRGAKQHGQHAPHGLAHFEAQLPQQAKSNDCREHIQQDVRAVAHEDAADCGIVLVSRKNLPVCDPGGDHIGRQHEQRLTNAVPAIDLAIPTVESELGILTG